MLTTFQLNVTVSLQVMKPEALLIQTTAPDSGSASNPAQPVFWMFC